MKLEWAALALQDRNQIFDFIEQDDPRAAAAVDERISSQVDMLTRFPEGGRPGRVEHTRELVIRHTSYVVAYAVLGDTVRILRVLHSAQLWPDEMSDWD